MSPKFSRAAAPRLADPLHYERKPEKCHVGDPGRVSRPDVSASVGSRVAGSQRESDQ
jgi:hypothetical protein